MHSKLSTVIHSTREKVFPIACDLPRWPEYLPHYNYNRYLAPAADGGVIKMSARRSGIPLTWTSVYRYDSAAFQMHFEHLKPTTRGMIVRWDMDPVPEGVRVTITHDFTLAWPIIGSFVANVIIGAFLVDHVAGLTLAGLKRHMEARS